MHETCKWQNLGLWQSKYGPVFILCHCFFHFTWECNSDVNWNLINQCKVMDAVACCEELFQKKREEDAECTGLSSVSSTAEPSTQEACLHVRI